MIEWLIITTAWIWGIKAVFTEPFIFHKQGFWLEERLSKWLYKPLFRCPICMSSIHGTLIYWLKVGHSFDGWIIFVVALAGVSFILTEFLYPDEVD